MPLEERVSVPEKNYKRLIDRDLLLSCLERAGVDGWEGYDYALELYYGQESEIREDE